MELLNKDRSVSIHHRNLQYLATEMYKVKNNMCPEIFKELFQVRQNNTYNLRSLPEFIVLTFRTVYNEAESISNLGPKIWDLVSVNIRNSSTLNEFKSSIKTWMPSNCPRRQVFVDSVGFM